MGESFVILAKLHIIDDTTATNLRRAVGFRNVAVHDYEDIDWAIVYAICTRHLQDFRKFAQNLVQYSGL